MNKLRALLKYIIPQKGLDIYRFVRDFDPKYLTTIQELNITKGNNVFIGKYSTLANSVIGNNIKIGEGSYVDNVKYGDFSYNAPKCTLINCSVGKFCSIGQGVSVGMGRHPLNTFVSTHPAFYSKHKQCGYTFSDKSYFDEMGYIIIGNDVWIGANAIILDDITIGNGAVIAANSLVNANVPPYAIVGGTPAKIIRYRFNEEDISFLNKLEWWNKDLAWLRKNFKNMHNIDNLKKSQTL